MSDKVNLRQLRYFLAIVETKSLTRAASALHVAQPALSRRMKELEDAVGAPLFVRSSRGVTLTEAGQLLAARAAAMFRELDGLQEDLAQASGAPRGDLAFGMPPSMRDLVTMPLVRAYRERYPGVTLHLQEGVSGVLAEQVRTGALDCAVVSDLEPLVHAESEPLVTEPLFLVGPRAARLDRRTSVGIEVVADKPLILTSHPNSMRLVIENALVRAGRNAHIVLDSNSTAVILDAVEAGLGFSVLSRYAVARAMAARRVSATPVDGLSVSWCFVHPRDTGLPMAGRLLLDALRAIVRGESP